MIYGPTFECLVILYDIVKRTPLKGTRFSLKNIVEKFIKPLHFYLWYVILNKNGRRQMAASAQESKTYNIGAGSFYAELCDMQICMRLNLELKSQNPMQGGCWYRFHHGMSMTSWGEKITISVYALSENSTRVDVHSECGMPTQIFDWGKNKKNVKAIFDYLDQYVPLRAPALVSASSPTPAPKSNVCYCSACGTQLTTEDNFCYQCGKRRD